MRNKQYGEAEVKIVHAESLNMAQSPHKSVSSGVGCDGSQRDADRSQLWTERDKADTGTSLVQPDRATPNGFGANRVVAERQPVEAQGEFAEQGAEQSRPPAFRVALIAGGIAGAFFSLWLVSVYTPCKERQRGWRDALVQCTAFAAFAVSSPPARSVCPSLPPLANICTCLSGIPGGATLKKDARVCNT